MEVDDPWCLWAQVHETLAQQEAKFHLVPYETGRYRFCLSLNHDRAHSRYVVQREGGRGPQP